MHPKHNFKIKTILFAAVLTTFLSGCAKSRNLTEQVMSVLESVQETEKDLPTDTQEVLRQETRQQPQPDQNEQERLEMMEEAYRSILDSCTEDFIGNHLVDMTFLAWLSSKYGDACITEIAKEAEAPQPDPEIWYRQTGNTIHVLWLLYCRETGFQQYQLENIEWKECASADEVSLAFTGDINFSEGYSTTRHLDGCANGIYDCFSEDLLKLMNDTDIMMINNEFTYSTRGEPLAGKTYTFRANPSRAGLLHAFGTDIVNLANNHVYDYGPDALMDTIAALDQEGIPHIGAGGDITEASKPYYFVCNGRKIAIVAATQIERSTNYTKEATEDSPGVLKTLNPDKFVKVIEEADKNSDHVIAVVHWGTEGDSRYGQDQESLARAFVDAGADAVIGGHTHCLQGFEIMDGVPIIYSLGNFWFSSKTLDTGLAKVTIDSEGALTMSFIPCIQENFRTRLVTEEEEKERILTFMQEHSAGGIIVTKEGNVLQEAQQ